MRNRESRAAVYRGVPGEIEILSYPLREPKAGEIIVRIEACTLCGSDFHSFFGRRSVPVPTILGHEIVGRIEAFGPDSNRVDVSGVELSENDRIVWAIVAHCGTCRNCLNDLPQKCLKGVKYGHERFGDSQDFRGGLAESCILAPGTSIVRVPESLSNGAACLASCAAATTFAALDAVGDLEGRAACVIGGGMLGLIACSALASRGASRVVCFEPAEHRRTLALKFGAKEVYDPAVRTELANQGMFDLLFEMSGHGETFMNVWPSLSVGGRVALVGSVFPDAPISIPLDSIVRRNLSLFGIHNYAPKHLIAAVNFLSSAEDRFPFDTLIERWFSLSEVGSAFLKTGCRDAVRVGVIPS